MAPTNWEIGVLLLFLDNKIAFEGSLRIKGLPMRIATHLRKYNFTSKTCDVYQWP